MINQSKLYEYIGRVSKSRDVKEDIKENGMPSDLSIAIVHIKNEAKKGDERAIEALKSIQKSFDIG